MKAVALSIVISVAACAEPQPEGVTVEPEPATAEAVSALTQVNTSCLWIPGKNCYGRPNDGNNIWPADAGIRTMQVVFRAGPDRLDHRQRTFLAFVVWNSDTVGRIFRVDVGARGADFHANLGEIVATRTSGAPDTSTGSTGTASGGPVNPPQPNVDEALIFQPPYLDVVKRHAALIDASTADFLRTPAIGVDDR